MLISHEIRTCQRQTPTLDNNVPVFAEGRALHRESERGPGAGLGRQAVRSKDDKTNEGKGYLLKGLVMLFVVRHGWPLG